MPRKVVIAHSHSGIETIADGKLNRRPTRRAAPRKAYASTNYSRSARLTSFQCAARGQRAARATRRDRCRDRRCILKERPAAGVTPSRQRIPEARSAGLGTAACLHHWRV